MKDPLTELLLCPPSLDALCSVRRQPAQRITQRATGLWAGPGLWESFVKPQHTSGRTPSPEHQGKSILSETWREALLKGHSQGAAYKCPQMPC